MTRAAPAAAAGALGVGLLAAIAGAMLGPAALTWFTVAAAAGGAAVGGRAFHRGLERRRRNRFLREPALPTARLLGTGEGDP